ncbi:tetratricopeptide repeat protein [Planktosalinus lacus]|nr:tetratricopeptide repeat protein [Planktosalinus lacus]
MKRLVAYTCLFFTLAGMAQAKYTSEQAFKLQQQLIDTADYYKYSPQLNKFITYSFRAIELMPQIEGKHYHKLRFYARFTYRLHQLGLIKESIRQSNIFIDYYERYQSEIQLTPDDEISLFQYAAFNYSILAQNYTFIDQQESAAFIYKKAIAFTSNRQSRYYVSALNNYGLYFYYEKKELDSALHYFEDARAIAEENFSDVHIYGSVIDNIADLYLETGRIEEANSLYRQNFDFYKVVPYEENEFYPIDYGRIMSSGRQYINTSLQLNNIEAATQTLTEMQSYIDEQSEAQWRLDYLIAKVEVEQAGGEYQQANQTLQEISLMKDSIAQQEYNSITELQNTLNEIVLDRIQESLAYEKEEQQEEIRKQRLRFWIVVLILTLSIFILFYLYQQRKQSLLIADEKAKNTALRNKQLNYEVEAKKRDLTDFAINLSQSHEWAKDLYEQIQSIKETRGRARKKQFEELEAEIKNKVVFDKETETFYNKLDSLSAAFYKKLQETYPKLSKNDIRLCSLIRLKIDSQEIATLQNITIASLNTARYRIRKKLKLSENTDLDTFIQSL